MSKSALVTFGIFAAICAVLIPYFAIHDEGASDTAPPVKVASEFQGGRTLFQINCGVCHTLQAAGTEGKVGPNLDQLLATGPASTDTIKANSDRVLSAIKNGVSGRMPAGILGGQQADEVAKFVGANVRYLPQ